ncbi:MAG: SufD family Fe-S cluster assembly protein [Ruminococcaceae bacterium]|nr:SufD family Fe-S cluster assembly protein [Oscillospiraceae bacterium]
MNILDFKFDSTLTPVDRMMIAEITDLTGIPDGALSIRKNGEGLVSSSSANVEIRQKTDKPGIDILVKPFTKGEEIHMPVIITEEGIVETVYNDFFIGEGAEVTIIAGCGIHNCGNHDSQHDGIHTFNIGKNAYMKYVEKHYGDGDGNGKRILNPVTVVNQEEGSYCEMEMVQIKGVDSTYRKTKVNLAINAKLYILEKLMTHGDQIAKTDMIVNLNGEGSSAQIISRTVGKDNSTQIFYPNAVGNNSCSAHIQCDSIIMNNAKISSIPAISANHPDAQIVHEAAIGKINSDQLVKLQTFGLSEEEAEEVIIQGFLK